jgi:hypothetical protein
LEGLSSPSARRRPAQSPIQFAEHPGGSPPSSSTTRAPFAAGSTATTTKASRDWRIDRAPARLDSGAPGLGRRIRILLREPGAWTVRQLRRRPGYSAMSLATLARRVREQASWRRPRLVAKSDPEEAAVLAALHQGIAARPGGAVILAEDGAHVNRCDGWARRSEPDRRGGEGRIVVPDLDPSADVATRGAILFSC